MPPLSLCLLCAFHVVFLTFADLWSSWFLPVPSDLFVPIRMLSSFELCWLQAFTMLFCIVSTNLDRSFMSNPWKYLCISDQWRTWSFKLILFVSKKTVPYSHPLTCTSLHPISHIPDLCSHPFSASSPRSLRKHQEENKTKITHLPSHWVSLPELLFTRFDLNPSSTPIWP